MMAVPSYGPDPDLFLIAGGMTLVLILATAWWLFR
jgi:hypothetical protein